jgi:large subunit ribosomal protein L10
MPTQKKIDVVEEYTQKFKNAKSIFMADFGGINVAEANMLRRSFRSANIEYKVLKNTLAKRSFDDAGIEGIDQLLIGMTGFAFSEDDPVAPIKIIKDFNKSLPKEKRGLVVKGCLFEGKVFGPEKADELANLPSREVLLAQLLGMLQSPMSKLLGALQGTGQKLVGTLDSLKNQKS